jgi:regulator of protease activity HflC (stomatin/prohibitin superfamily)
MGVVTIFGKYRRLLKPGLSLKIPLIEVIHVQGFHSEPFG